MAVGGVLIAVEQTAQPGEDSQSISVNVIFLRIILDVNYTLKLMFK